MKDTNEEMKRKTFCCISMSDEPLFGDTYELNTVESFFYYILTIYRIKFMFFCKEFYILYCQQSLYLN